MCTWGKLLYPSNFHIFSDTSDKMLPITDVHSVLGGSHLPSGSLDYRTSQEKFIIALAHLFRHGLKTSGPGSNMNWFMLMDDDTFLLPHKLSDLLRNFSGNDPVFPKTTSAVFGNLCNNANFCGGSGVIFTRAAAERIARLLETQPLACLCNTTDTSSMCYYDVILSKCLLENNIPIYHTNLLDGGWIGDIIQHPKEGLKKLKHPLPMDRNNRHPKPIDSIVGFHGNILSAEYLYFWYFVVSISKPDQVWI